MTVELMACSPKIFKEMPWRNSPMYRLSVRRDFFYHATAADFQREGKQREAFKTMIREIAALAEAMGVPFERDMVEVNLKILSSLAPEATTSMQRDVMEGKDSEIDGLIYEVVRMGERYHVPVPMYAKVAEKLRENL